MRIAMLLRCVVVRLMTIAMVSRFRLLEGVGNPVRDEARYTPLSSMPRDGVKISVCPVGNNISAFALSRTLRYGIMFYLPSCITLGKSTTRLLNLDRPMRLLNQRHLDLAMSRVGMESGQKTVYTLNARKERDTRTSFIPQSSSAQNSALKCRSPNVLPLRLHVRASSVIR